MKTQSGEEKVLSTENGQERQHRHEPHHDLPFTRCPFPAQILKMKIRPEYKTDCKYCRAGLAWCPLASGYLATSYSEDSRIRSRTWP